MRRILSFNWQLFRITGSAGTTRHSSFILSSPPFVSVFVRHQRHSVTALSGNGLRRRFSNDLRLLMRHSRSS